MARGLGGTRATRLPGTLERTAGPKKVYPVESCEERK